MSKSIAQARRQRKTKNRGKAPAEASATFTTAWAEATATLVTGLLLRSVDAIIQRARGTWGDRWHSPVASVSCPHCGEVRTGQLRRHGAYQRTLLLLGLAVRLAIPRLRCTCNGSADVSFPCLRPISG